MCQRVVSNLAFVTVGGQSERCDSIWCMAIESQRKVKNYEDTVGNGVPQISQMFGGSLGASWK